MGPKYDMDGFVHNHKSFSFSYNVRLEAKVHIK